MTQQDQTNKDELLPDEYYVQNKQAGYLGNSPMWWAKDGKGYTAYILGAHRFPKAEAEELVNEDPEKLEMYKCADIDARLHLVFDSQDKKRLGTDEPCGWLGGYADTPQPETQAEALSKIKAHLYKVLPDVLEHKYRENYQTLYEVEACAARRCAELALNFLIKEGHLQEILAALEAPSMSVEELGDVKIERAEAGPYKGKYVIWGVDEAIIEKLKGDG